jgi:hypothetical protein
MEQEKRAGKVQALLRSLDDGKQEVASVKRGDLFRLGTKGPKGVSRSPCSRVCQMSSDQCPSKNVIQT